MHFVESDYFCLEVSGLDVYYIQVTTTCEEAFSLLDQRENGIRQGDSGLYISKIILGTAGSGSSKWQEWILEEEDALPLLEHAFKVGINTWDTADVFSNGRSEEIIGKALKKHNIPRSEIVILTNIF
ncbi:Versiconal hemiacetal acetate reductase [Lachnellula occidentalis]|uniref:Versiconal hemiacetal acetate reductase n=1 Tax=Lachnellula occidentalis TaxID=215460 RepID=A0A8H8UKH8_9HELO|nr:Versiconal hemiacetal acetate reductase [Lachnellula occidentalis]